MNARTTVILLVLLLVGIGFLLWTQTNWFVSRSQPGGPAAPEGAFKPLTPDVGPVEKLSLETPGVGKVALVRRDGAWRLTEPIAAAADAAGAGALAMTASTLHYVRRYAPGEKGYPRDDLTHLSAPLRVLSFTDEKGHGFTLKVGQRVPLSSRQTYVQLAGSDDVYVVETDLQERLNRSASDLREMEVVRFPVAQAVRVEIKGDESYQLVKLGGQWSMDLPVAARADQAKVEALLAGLSSITASRFVDEGPRDLAAYGLAEPRLTATVELAPEVQTDEPRAQASGQSTAPSRSRLVTTHPTTTIAPAGKVITIAFGTAAEGKAFAKLADQPAVFTVDQARLKNLSPRRIDLRDPRVLDLGNRELVRVDLDLATGEALTLEKPQDQWRLTRPLAGRADEGSVNELLVALREMKASEFQDNPAAPAAYGLEPPVGKLVLHFRGSEQTTTLLLGKATESGQMGFVQPAGSKSVAVVPAADYGKLLRPPAGYWDKTLLALPVNSTVTQLDIAQPGAPVVALQQDGPGRFKLVAPVSAEADHDNVFAAVAGLRTIRADKVVSVGDRLPDRFAALKPVVVTLSYAAEPPATAPAASAPATGTATATAPATTSAPSTRPAASQPAVTQVRLLLARDQKKSYLWIPAVRPMAVGELSEQFFNTLTAEMRERTVLKLDPAQAVSVKMVLDEVTLEMARAGDVWRYTADRRVKVDAEKVRQFLTELSRMKAQRFADYSDKVDPTRFGLNKPVLVLEVADATGHTDRLTVARIGPVGVEGYYASSSQVPGVFVLAAETPKKMRQSLEQVRSEKTGTPAPPKPEEETP